MRVLLTPSEVGEELGISESLVKRLTREQEWPHIRFSRETIRFRREHIEQIIAMRERAAGSSFAESPEFALSPQSKGRVR